MFLVFKNRFWNGINTRPSINVPLGQGLHHLYAKLQYRLLYVLNRHVTRLLSFFNVRDTSM